MHEKKNQKKHHFSHFKFVFSYSTYTYTTKLWSTRHYLYIVTILFLFFNKIDQTFSISQAQKCNTNSLFYNKYWSESYSRCVEFALLDGAFDELLGFFVFGMK